MTTAAPRPKRPASPPFWRTWLFLVPTAVAPAVLAWVVAVAMWPPAALLSGGLALLVTLLMLRRLRVSRSLIFYELLRSARRDRNLLFRCLYACLLLGVLCWFYMSWFGDPLLTLLLRPRGVALALMPRFAGQFFTRFLAAQMATVLLLTPVYTASVIAEEKERRTLEFLLATHLSNSEIVLSKLTARLANLALLLLAGLPVLALTQLWGGVDPLLLAGGFAVTGVTMLSVGSLSALVSVYSRNSLDALLRTYIVLGLYLMLGACVPGLNLGHPVVLTWMASGTGSPGGSVRALAVFVAYATFHLLAAAVFVRVAVTRLRAGALHPPPPAPAPRPAGKGAAAAPPVQGRPPVGDSPLLWKELYAEGPGLGDRAQSPADALVGVLVVGVVVSGLILAIAGLREGHTTELLNPWARGVGAALGCVLALFTAFHAARTVSRERERQTLDSLRSIPEDDAAILRAKWLGSLCSTRRAWWLLGTVWVWAVVTGALVPVALPLLTLAWGVYAGFAAAVGLYCSAVCRTTLRATLVTAVVLLAVGVGPWVLWDLGPLVLPRGAVGDWLVSFQHDGLTAPMPLWVLGFGYKEMFRPGLAAWAGRVLAALAGLACYAGAGWLLWRRALARFRAEA